MLLPVWPVAPRTRARGFVIGIVEMGMSLVASQRRPSVQSLYHCGCPMSEGFK